MADVEALVGPSGPVPFDVVERGEDRFWLDDVVDLTPDLAVGRRHGCRIQAQIEERGVAHAAAAVLQLRVDAGPGPAIEASHQRTVEEDAFEHGLQSVHTPDAWCKNTSPSNFPLKTTKPTVARRLVADPIERFGNSVHHVR